HLICISSTTIPTLTALYFLTFLFLHLSFSFSMSPLTPTYSLFPYTTLFRSHRWDILGIWYPCRDWAIKKSWLILKENILWKKPRSEEHTSELQSRFDIVCRLLLEKKKKAEVFLLILREYRMISSR